MVKIGAAEAVVSLLLLFTLGRTTKNADPTLKGIVLFNPFKTLMMKILITNYLYDMIYDLLV